MKGLNNYKQILLLINNLKMINKSFPSKLIILVIIWEEISLAVEPVEKEEWILFLQCLVILKDLKIKKIKIFKHFIFFSLFNISINWN